MASKVTGAHFRTCVVLPTLNEAENVEPLLLALLGIGSVECVFVVDDDSQDGTADIVARIAARDARVRLIRRRGERGLGSAYRRGFDEAIRGPFDAILTMDCDHSHDPDVIPLLVRNLEDADLVIGSRYTRGGRIEGWGIHRRGLSILANVFVHATLRLPVRDCTSAYRLYRRHLVDQIPWREIRSTGYAFLVETLFWATAVNGARVREVPIVFRDRVRGSSKLGWREAIQGAFWLLRLRLAAASSRRRSEQT